MSTNESVLEKPQLLPSYPKVGPRSSSTSNMLSDSQDDGDKPWSSIRAHTENISSVADNPFYKSFGRKHPIPAFSKRGSEPVMRGRRGSTSEVLSRDSEEEEIGEYHPGSGFVHKLLGKFSSLSSKEDAPVPDQMKRSTSLEELPTEDDIAKSVKTKPVDGNEGNGKPSNSSVSRLSYAKKAQSTDNLNNVHRKPWANHSHHRPPSLTVPLRHVETKRSEEKILSPRSPRDSHVEAPDVDLAREDIIIIETTPSVPDTKQENEKSDDSDIDTAPLSYREEMLPEELPKPNTVLNVRSIFENASAVNSKQTKVDVKRPKPESLSPYSSKSVDIVPDSKRERFAWSSQSSLDKDVTSSILPDKFSPSTPRAQDTPLSPVEDKRPSPLNAASSYDISTPRSDTSESSDTSSTKSSVLERRSMFDSPRLLGSSRPLPSPRNTASVKPTIGTKLSGPVKPAPLNIPASAAPSYTYKKSSPVVPVAPFKDNKEDNKDDGQPVMIFDKSKLSSMKNKPKRKNVYTPLDETGGGKAFNKKDLIISNELKSNNVDKPNKLDLTKKQEVVKNGFDSETAETNKDKPKIIQTDKKTVIELTNTVYPKEDKDKSSSTDQAKPVIANNESTSRPVAPPRASRTTSNNSIPKSPVTHQKRQAPLPTLDREKATPPKLETERPTPPKLEKEKVEGSMLFVSSSEGSSESESTPPVTPRTKPQEESKEQPIKGIPSIIADRLRKQNADPSRTPPVSALSSLISESTSKTSTDSNSETTRPGYVVAAENKKPKDEICSEIENEIAAVRKKMEGSRSKSSGVTQILDSSHFAKKRKENQRRRQENAAAQGIVPPLDLSSITDGDKSREYQPQVQREIKPCNIVFVGENAPTSRSLLKKKRSVKRRKRVNIHFNDAKTETFEYPSEETALEKYLEDHPHEPSDILVLEDFGMAGDAGESSDDVPDSVDVFETPVTPRGNADEDLLKSNTALSASGSLQSYRGRFQEEFQFGSSFQEPEPPAKVIKEEPAVDPDAMMLRPAEETDSNIWSTNDSSDLLF